jgi:hypothetical protein
LALPPVVAAPVGGLPGMRHVVWQVAACELHAIMQFVTFEVCAMRIFVAACAAEWHSATANPPPTSKHAIPPRRMMQHHLAGRDRECAGTLAKLAG